VARQPSQSGIGRVPERRDERLPSRPAPARTRAVRFRLAVLAVAIVAVAFVLLAFFALYSTDRELARQLEAKGLETAQWLDARLGPMARDGPRALLQAEVDRVTDARSGVHDVRVFLLGPEGGLSCVAARGGAVRISAAPNDRRAVRENRVVTEIYKPENGSRILDIASPLHRGTDVIGAVHLEISLGDADALMGGARRNLILATLAALGVTGLLLFHVLDRAIGRPAEDLVAAMERVRQGDLSAAVEVRRLDEFGWLGENLNRMLRRLREKEDELARFNTELKSQVAAATVELEQANHRLFDAQRALANSERLASLGQLASNIAHEIGTPLNSIYGHIQLLAAENGISEAARSRVAVVESQVERLTAIIENVLMTLRLPEAQLREVDTNPVVEGICAFTRPVIDRAGIKLERVLAPSLPKVYVDPAQLEQVVMNLFTNALDAMPGGGTLTLETAAGKGEHGETVEIRVRDTGVGIPRELHHKIFEPFFSTKAKGQGTGLGLAICQQILRAFRGSISVESEVGKGSTFTVSLPAVRGLAKPVDAAVTREAGP
jgi:signal transduction histidine kinase